MHACKLRTFYILRVRETF